MITEERAEQTLAAVKERLRVYIYAGKSGPLLVKNCKP